jgi:hypothetical protein
MPVSLPHRVAQLVDEPSDVLVGRGLENHWPRRVATAHPRWPGAEATGACTNVAPKNTLLDSN